jgi:hypothetical protein
MKIFWWSLLALVIIVPAVLYFLQKRREQRAQRDGVTVYATVVSVAPVKAFGKPSGILKIVMWLQEPGADRREITLRSRSAPGQKIEPGVLLAVVVDPNNPKQVYPAGPEAIKRVQLTGSRQERRLMRKKGL